MHAAHGAGSGTVEDWTIVNTTEMDHPFHLHGFRFQIMEIDGQPTPRRVAGHHQHPGRADRGDSAPASTITRAPGCSTATSWSTPSAA
jgi:FtsP/CotA-like multicopper oxidase with cupredoxin domain